METSPKVTPDQIIAEMHRTVDRLVEDGADRGDIKILARALRELRHSFRVLSEYKHFRKVTVFGSARCLPESPPYRQAEAFGREFDVTHCHGSYEALLGDADVQAVYIAPPHPMHAAASIARSAASFGTRIALPSVALPVGAEMNPPLAMMRLTSSMTSSSGMCRFSVSPKMA